MAALRPLSLLLLVSQLPVPAYAQGPLELSEPGRVTALAVAFTEGGDLVGAHADITVSAATGGSGHVFIDTRPLAGTDMQGSARIAARVAAALTGYTLEEHDFFFVIRSSSPIIAGPSAGGVMTLAAVVALQNAHLDDGEEAVKVDPRVMSTGTISPDGSIGPVGGILEKAEAAKAAGAKLFLVPEGQGVVPEIRFIEGLIVESAPVVVAEHCRTELEITCEEVGTIEELVELATGREFAEPELGEAPSTAQYEAELAPLATGLLAGAREFREVWGSLNGTSLPPAARDAVLSAIEQAREFLAEADAHEAASEHYSAASRAFSASIHGRHAALLLDHYVAGRSLDQVASALREARATVRAAEKAAGAANVTGMHALYTIGAAQERVSDAEAHVASGWARLNQSDAEGALFDAAWAVERSETVHWWLSLSEPFGPGPELPVPVGELADEFVELAAEMLAYASEVLAVEGGPARAAEQLERARIDQDRGFDAAALLEAAESQVLAALAIESVGATTPDRLNASRDQATRSIAEARSRGVEPVLAVALFEFAGAQDDRTTALEFYRTARVFAGFSHVLAGRADPTPSRFVGEWEEPRFSGHALPAGAYRSVAVGWFAIGVFTMTTLVVLTLAMMQRRRE